MINLYQSHSSGEIQNGGPLRDDGGKIPIFKNCTELGSLPIILIKTPGKS